jgi:hypothetical protein
MWKIEHGSLGRAELKNLLYTHFIIYFSSTLDVPNFANIYRENNAPIFIRMGKEEDETKC